MPRAIWKGAISFGLVHIPIGLYPGSSESGIDFDWVDKQSMDPVGYKRINKRTGKEVTKENIVKGVKVGDAEYVILSDDEIKAAYPKTTQTIEIESFVQAAEIPVIQFDRPYYLEPLAKGEKVYALLREAMLASEVVGIARVVMHTKEHLAALIATERGLLLNTLRWTDDIRPWSDLKIPGGRHEGTQGQRAEDGDPADRGHDRKMEARRLLRQVHHAMQALVAKRQKAGATKVVEPLEEGEKAPSNVVDLTALLAESLGKKPAGAGKGARGGKVTSISKATRKRA